MNQEAELLQDEVPGAVDQDSPVSELPDGGEPLAEGTHQEWDGGEPLAEGSNQEWDGGEALAEDSTPGWDGGEAPAGGQLPRPVARGCVVAASLTLIVAMLAVAVTGFTGSTWNYSRHTMDREASVQLANLADAMAAAGAPRAAVLHVRAAAQPGLNRGAALEALGAAVQILAEAGDDPHLVPLRRQLHRVYLEIYEQEYGAPPTPERLRPTVPSFEAHIHFGFWILDFGLASLDFGLVVVA